MGVLYTDARVHIKMALGGQGGRETEVDTGKASVYTEGKM